MNRHSGIVPIIISALIIAVVFLVLILVVPLAHGDAYWTAVAFGWVAIIVATAANIFIVLTSRSTKSALYRTSISVVSITYMIVACAASFAFMLLPTVPAWIIIVVQVVLLALCLIGLLAGNASANFIENGEAATQASVATISALRMQAASLQNLAHDQATRQALKKVCEELQFSDPVSTASCQACDQQLQTYMNQLALALQNNNGVEAQNICNLMSMVISQRAAFCKASK